MEVCEWGVETLWPEWTLLQQSTNLANHGRDYRKHWRKITEYTREQTKKYTIEHLAEVNRKQTNKHNRKDTAEYTREPTVENTEDHIDEYIRVQTTKHTKENIQLSTFENRLQSTQKSTMLSKIEKMYKLD